jgi:Cu/Ag efflux pump CusA
VPRAKVVRGFSNFGVSFVYIVFEDGTDLHWARSRVLEYLNFAQKRLPAGVTPSLGPDASGVGWVFQYVLESTRHGLAELRTLQDWLVRFRLTAAEGVAEVAGIGGFERQYQIVVDPRNYRPLVFRSRVSPKRCGPAAISDISREWLSWVVENRRSRFARPGIKRSVTALKAG